MRILAFDLSTRQGSIAISGVREHSHGESTETREWPNDRRSSAPFFSALDEIVRKHGAPDLIVVGLGPGSYTGTRIAISAAIGLEVACGSKLCGLPSICATSRESDYAVIGDAKRATFFFGRINQHQIAGGLDLLSQSELRDRIDETTVPIYTADYLPQFDRVGQRFPRAGQLCLLAQSGKNLSHPPLEPIYLRGPHITSRTSV